MTKHNESALLTKVASVGNSITSTFIEHSTFMKKFLSRFLSCEQDIEDVVQEFYIRAAKAEGERKKQGKVIDNFISEDANLESLYPHPEGQFLVVRPKNDHSTQVQGLELALGARLDPLADWLKGTELQARYTFVDGKTSENSTIRNVDYLIEGLSDSFNLLASYQNRYLKAVLSLSYRDRYLRNAKAGQGQPEMVEAYSQLDFSLSWFHNKSIEYYLESRNLLGANQRTFSIYQERLLHFENTGTSLNLGMRFKY